MQRASHSLRHPAPSAEERFHWILTQMVRIAVPIHVALVALFFWLGLPTMARFNLVSIASYAGVHLLLRHQRVRGAFALGAGQLLLFNGLATLAVGWPAGFHYYLLLLPVLVVLHPDWSRLVKASVCLAVCAAYGLLALHAYLAGTIATLTTGGADALGVFNALTFAIALSVLAFIAAKATGDAEQELRQATATLEELSNRDPLTGLLNRRATEHSLQTAHARLRRLGEPYAVAMVDLDHFKRVNDRYGHACGDGVLGAIAGALEGALRDTDHVARWGGEEFLILLANTTPAGAQHAAAKLLNAVRACRIECENGRVLTTTATIGLAASSTTRGIDATVNAADEALYAGKRAGRDRVELEPTAPRDAALEPVA